jgi:IS605 OrfB family transposase
VELRVTPAQRERCFGLLRSGGDLWAAVLELNTLRRHRGDAPIVTYHDLCRELTRAGPGCAGALSSVGARSILHRYSDAWFSAAARRRGGDLRTHFPRRRRSLMPSRYYAGTFSLQGRVLTLPTVRGAAPLCLRLTRCPPYGPSSIRSVTLVNVGPKLFVEVTAEVPVASYDESTAPDPDTAAGVDLGIIHPFALAGADQGLVVSGRAIRAEHRLHLAEKKARARAVARRAPKKGQAGSRRWRKYRARTRKLEERHRRRVAQATHEGARAVVDFAVANRIGTLVVGDPRGLLNQDAGRRQNLAVHNWRPGQAIAALSDKAALAGIRVELVNERGTSSTCPNCRARVAKPKGRRFSCAACGLVAHRDVVGAVNIASRVSRGGEPFDPSGLEIMHRRAGRHLPGRTRRDPRRVMMDHHRGRLGPWPAVARPEDLGESLDRDASTA